MPWPWHCSQVAGAFCSDSLWKNVCNIQNCEDKLFFKCIVRSREPPHGLEPCVCTHNYAFLKCIFSCRSMQVYMHILKLTTSCRRRTHLNKYTSWAMLLESLLFSCYEANRTRQTCVLKMILDEIIFVNWKWKIWKQKIAVLRNTKNSANTTVPPPYTSKNPTRKHEES